MNLKLLLKTSHAYFLSIQPQDTSMLASIILQITRLLIAVTEGYNELYAGIV